MENLNHFGVIVSDQSRKNNAKSLGRNPRIIGGDVQTWRCDVLSADGGVEQVPASFRIACNGDFTGHVIVLMHGNYNEQNIRGHLYYEEGGRIVLEEEEEGDEEVEEEEGDDNENPRDFVGEVVGYVNGLGATHVYIYACGQGAPNVLEWYRGVNGFGMDNVWSPCVGACLGGADPQDIRLRFGLD